MKNKHNNDKNADIVIDKYINEDSKKYDPDGSWTGVPANPKEIPIQDADDL